MLAPAESQNHREFPLRKLGEEASDAISGPSFFPHSQNFTINGGVFSSTLVHRDNESPSKSGFRSICMGDLHLLSETKQFNIVQTRAIRRRKTGMVLRYAHQTIGMRTIYRARVFGCTQIVTAIVYHGAQSDQWKESACRTPGIRHPHILQLFGVTSSHAGVDALIYHDDFIPVNDIRKKNRKLPFASCYTEYSMQNELADARIYWRHATGQLLVPQKYTVWIRQSTGRLCLDVSPADSDFEAGCEIQWKSGPHLAPNLSILSSEHMDVSCLTRSLELEDVHTILGHLPRWESSLLMTHGALSVGSVLVFAHKPVGSVSELACLPGAKTEFFAWDEWPADFNPKVMNDGWTRFDLPERSTGVHHIESSLKIEHRTWSHAVHAWLSQANHLFSILYNNLPAVQRQSCMLVKDIEFSLSIWYPEDDCTLDGTFMVGDFPEAVYLFACPLYTLRIEERAVIQIPAASEAFYWSLDPLGAHRLTAEEAERFSLPSVSFAARVWGCSWNATEYDVLRRFYLDKGYNPDNTDAAHDLGYPLLEIHDTPLVVSSEEDIQTAAEHDEKLLSTYPTRDEWCLLCEHHQSRIQSLKVRAGTQRVVATLVMEWRKPLRLYRWIASQVELYIIMFAMLISAVIFWASVDQATRARIV